MITLYSGTPGSGKSCHQAEDIYNFLKYEHGCIIANYPIDESRFESSFKRGAIFVSTENNDICPKNLIKFSKMYFSKHKFKEGKIRLYIDEAQLLFNCREWDKENRKEWVKFFTQHRKYGYDIYLVAQFDRMLDRQIRSLIEYEVMHRKLSNVGTKGKVLSVVMGGGTYLAVRMWYPLKTHIDTKVMHIRKRWYSMYDSYKDFDIPEGNIEGSNTLPEGV